MRAISTDASVADRKQAQADDASANLDLTINSSVSETVIANHRAEIAELKKSVDWLKSEEAGVCEHCGCDIPVARLQAVPSTRLCVSCEEQLHPGR